MLCLLWRQICSSRPFQIHGFAFLQFGQSLFGCSRCQFTALTHQYRLFHPCFGLFQSQLGFRTHFFHLHHPIGILAHVNRLRHFFVADGFGIKQHFLQSLWHLCGFGLARSHPVAHRLYIQAAFFGHSRNVTAVFHCRIHQLFFLGIDCGFDFLLLQGLHDFGFLAFKALADFQHLQNVVAKLGFHQTTDFALFQRESSVFKWFYHGAIFGKKAQITAILRRARVL